MSEHKPLVCWSRCGNCPRCGFPIYEAIPGGGMLPTVTATCECFERKHVKPKRVKNVNVTKDST